MRLHYIRGNQDIEMWILDIDEFKSVFDEGNLWKYAFDVLSEQVSVYYKYEQMMLQSTVKKLVLEHIRYIWSMHADRDRISL